MGIFKLTSAVIAMAIISFTSVSGQDSKEKVKKIADSITWFGNLIIFFVRTK